jgi:hypothetical protein
VPAAKALERAVLGQLHLRSRLARAAQASGLSHNPRSP